jgi:hypothetical protein
MTCNSKAVPWALPVAEIARNKPQHNTASPRDGVLSGFPI